MTALTAFDLFTHWPLWQMCMCIPPLVSCLWFHSWLKRSHMSPLHILHHHRRLMCRLALGGQAAQGVVEWGGRREMATPALELSISTMSLLVVFSRAGPILSRNILNYCVWAPVSLLTSSIPSFNCGHCSLQLCPHSHLHFLCQSHVSISIVANISTSQNKIAVKPRGFVQRADIPHLFPSSAFPSAGMME